jgi:threonine/homoserine/homoserine lactone efflux protein
MADTALAPLLLQFAAAYGCMLVVPGQNMLLVMRSHDGSSALKPLLAAAGIACGAALASLVAASSAAVLPTGSGFRALSGVLLAGILLRTAVQSSRCAAPMPLPEAGLPSSASLTPFLLGLGAALLNPVSVPYFASFFVSHACSRLAAVLTCGLVFTMAGLWFSTIGLVTVRLGRLAVPIACRRALNLATAALLVALAVRALWAAIV